MTDYLTRALEHAQRGFYVFPAQQDKRPVYGFMDWESAASTDADTIRGWWDKFSDSLPAVAPGKSGLAVIDVDRHEGSADGFASLVRDSITIPEGTDSGTSLSGNGTHFWFRAGVGSLNGVIPGVDRKAQGGYVIVPYTLPYALDIRTPLPEKLAGSRLHSFSKRTLMTPEQLDYWLLTVGSGPILSNEMEALVRAFEPTGHAQMSQSIARVVRRAAKGDSGAAVALERMLETWLSGTHNTGNPYDEFQTNVKTAIEKFGAPPDDDADLEEFNAMASGERPFTLNMAELLESFLRFCDKSYPEWRESEKAPRLMEVLQKSNNLMHSLKSDEEVERLITVTKVALKREAEQ